MELYLFNQFHSFFNRFFIHRYQVMMTFGQGLLQASEYAIQRNHRFQFQQSTQYDHVECFGIIHFIGCIHCVDAIHFDIFTRRRVDDAISVVNQDTARLYLTFEFLQ